MEEFVDEFDLATNEPIVLLNEIDIVSGHDNSNLSDFINGPVNVNSEYEPFVDILNPDNSKNTDRFSNQLQVIKNRNGVRYMKFKKSKKVVKAKLVDQHPQQCPVTSCSAMFTSSVKLKKHIQEHAFKKKYQCDICFEDFNVLENLTLHISLHSGDGRCPQCGKIFRRLASLEGHIKTHFKNEYYMCTQGCDEMFHFEWMLKQHINQYHPNENSKIQQEKEELAKERKQRRKNMLNCQYCGKQFAKNCLLIRHERIHNGQKPFKCSDCDRCFAQKNTLIIHQRRHSDQRMFKCSQCPQTFVQKGNLISHVAKCHTYKEGEPSFPCKQCSCIFKKIGTLNAHISKFHTSQGVFVHPDDDLGFRVDDVMKQLNELHRTSPMEADLISKELFFNLPITSVTTEELPSAENINNDNAVYGNAMATHSSPLQLAVHTSNGMVTHRNVMQRIDGNIRWYVCLYCPKEFRRPSDLIRHIRIHTKEKPFSCPVVSCAKRFSVKSSLSTHLNTHLKSSQEQTCRVCQQTFHSADSFDDHCRLSHQENPMFQCFICSQLCVTNGDLKRHLKCHRSPVKIKKSIPRKECDDGIQLDIIMKDPIILTKDGQIEVATEKSVTDQEQRKYECTVCFSSFKRKNHLKEHVLSHLGVKSHKCDICFKSFGKMSILNRHLLYHSNEKKFKCGKCSATCISKNQLNRHSLKHTNQRNVMCPYCQKRFKSKATCRTHMLIHKTEWVKQFKEQMKSGTIQFEEDTPNPSNGHVVLNIIPSSPPSSTIEDALETLNGAPTESNNENVHGIEDSNQVLFTNLIEETQIDDSGNQFEYFLLLPTTSEQNENGVSTEVRTDAEQFIVNDEPMNFTNLHFIQLDQSPLLEMQDSPSTPLLTNYRINGNHLTEAQPSESDQQTDLISISEVNTFNVAEPSSEENQTNVVTTESNQLALTNKNSKKSRSRKSTKSINKCEICSKIFQKPIDLRRHIRTHTLEKPFSCTHCSRAFSLKSTLQNHIKHRHTNIKQMFPCTVCWKGYSSRHSMITHMLIHSNSRPFKCEFCSITFRTRGHLKIHQQVHLRESKKYKVNPSDIKTRKEKTRLLSLLNVMKEFNNPKVEINNPKVQHVDDNNFSEPVRVERFDTRMVTDAIDEAFSDSLIKDVYQCSACPDQFSDVDSLKVHKRTHKEISQCPDCDKTFTKPSLLKRHMVVHFGRKEFVCKICHKSYTQKATLQAHMSLHADGTLFECSNCQKKFNFKTNLRTHEKKCMETMKTNDYEHLHVTEVNDQTL